MSSINTTPYVLSFRGPNPAATEDKSYNAEGASNIFDINTAIVSLKFVRDPTGTTEPSLSVQATWKVEESLYKTKKGAKAARSIRDMHTFHVDMMNRHPAGSKELRNSLRNGLEQRVKHHNDAKAGSDLGLSFVDEPVADQNDELGSQDMEDIIAAADQADLIDETNREREKLQAARLAAEDEKYAAEEEVFAAERGFRV